MKALRHQGGGQVKNSRSKRVIWEEGKSAFKNRIRSGVITNITHKVPSDFLQDAQFLFARRIKNAIKDHRVLKTNVEFVCEFTKTTSNEYELKHFTTSNTLVDMVTDVKKLWKENIEEKLLTQLQDFQDVGSGWSLKTIVNLTVKINKHEPFRGSAYIPLPSYIVKKHACINVQNDDDRCFLWAVVSALYPAAYDKQSIKSYPHHSQVLNSDGMHFPMTMNQVAKFEKRNNISINVYILKKKKNWYKVLPTLLTKCKKDRHINLLMIQDHYEEDRPVNYHFCWIKNLSRLVGSQLNRHEHKIHICDRCLHYFYQVDKLLAHEETCAELNTCKINMPAKGECAEFKNFNSQERIPFAIYMDIESLLKPVNKRRGMKTACYQEHEAFSIGLYFKCSYDDSLSYYNSYRGTNCGKWFANELKQIVENIEPVYWVEQPMSLTAQEELDFRSSTACHICGKPFTNQDVKVRDHAHITSAYRGAAHKLCNLRYRDCKKIPVVCHNLSGYDAHFIIKDIAQEIEGHTYVLPVNKEKYISFTKTIANSDIKLQFIDSFRFLPYSLATLASNLKPEQLIEVRRAFPDENQLKLLTRKGVFPYDHVQSFANLEERELPSQQQFYNRLNKKGVSIADYEHAQRVWQECNIETLGQYADLYLKTDTILLADVFENFRTLCLRIYKLDPAHYVSSPGLSWNAMLKYTGVRLELITDIDLMMFIEKGIRGGISQCSNRYAKANNKYMPTYDPTQQDIYLQYYDVNNLYGWAMSQHLPYGDFKWLPDANIDVTTIADDNPYGYILEVDLEYPQQLHDVHKDLPLCPEKRIPPGSKQPKLLTTLYDKERYVIHYRALKQALKHGLKITRIHRVVQFKQSAWMKPYIELNTQMRTMAQNEFEKTFYKLMNNSAFGKTMEDVRKRKIVKLVHKWFGRFSAKVLLAKPTFKSSTIVSENLVIIELNKAEITLNKPVYVGMSVLDISKTKLYEFHYDYMVPNFDCKVLYCDTDSLIYDIKCPDIYDAIKKDSELFDTSDYQLDNPYGIARMNKKVPGKMKDENNGKVMTEFVGLRSKMYAIRVEGEDSIKKAKGVKNYIVKNTISFNDYINCLTLYNLVEREQNSIRAFTHQVYSITQTKVALSMRDDKRILIPGSHDTVPWGYYLNK